ncbi:MAG: hypothetical protein GY940_34020, partial [bacterium]|nr:hypothetical protein [bacterium]
MKTQDLSRKAAFAANQKLKEREYWLDQLSGDLIKSSFPALPPPTPSGPRRVRTLQHPFPRHLSGQLMKLSNQSDFRLHIIL